MPQRQQHLHATQNKTDVTRTHPPTLRGTDGHASTPTHKYQLPQRGAAEANDKKSWNGFCSDHTAVRRRQCGQEDSSSPTDIPRAKRGNRMCSLLKGKRTRRRPMCVFVKIMCGKGGGGRERKGNAGSVCVCMPERGSTSMHTQQASIPSAEPRCGS